jgi:hypothetical protein
MKQKEVATMAAKETVKSPDREPVPAIAKPPLPRRHLFDRVDNVVYTRLQRYVHAGRKTRSVGLSEGLQMPLRSLWMCGLVALGLSACTTPPSSHGAWISLFDGETLDGWTPKIRGFPLGENYRDTFRVRDGALAVSYDRYDLFGERFGHIFYRTPYTSYRLRLEYRFVEGHLSDTPGWAISNSGVMIFSQDPRTMAVDQSFPVSIEAQLLGDPLNGTPRTNANVCTPGTNIVYQNVLTTTHCLNSGLPTPPNNTWTRFEIEVTPAGEVIHRINDQEAMRYSGIQLDPEGRLANAGLLIAAAGGRLELDGGYISLQSEGHPIEFRKIELLPLK